MRRRQVNALVLSIASLMCAQSVSAQEAGSLGVTMGFPASIGVLWHVTEEVALRPEFSFSHTSSETESVAQTGVETSSDGNSVAVGFSALFHLARWDMLRAYVVPRYAYTRASTSAEASVGIPGLNFDTETRGHAVSVSFGARQTLGQRFAVYGELGLVYERLTTELAATESRGSAFGTRSGVGVVVYF